MATTSKQDSRVEKINIIIIISKLFTSFSGPEMQIAEQNGVVFRFWSKELLMLLPEKSCGIISRTKHLTLTENAKSIDRRNPTKELKQNDL